MRKFLSRHKLAVVLFIAVAVRLLIFWRFPGIFAFDATGAIHGSEAYDTYAQNLLKTGVYGRVPGVPDALISPLYSYVLAGVYALFGRGALQVALFHTLLDAISIALAYDIGRRLFGPNHLTPRPPRHRMEREGSERQDKAPSPHRWERGFGGEGDSGEWVGALAGLFYALYPYLIFQNLTVIDTPLFMTLMYAFLWLMILLRGRERFDRMTLLIAGLAGAALGLAILSRAIILPLAGLAALWLLFRLNRRQTIVRLLPVALVSAAIFGVWLARNYRVYGSFVIALNTGENFYQGNSVYTLPYFHAGYDVQWVPIPPLRSGDPRYLLDTAYLNRDLLRIPAFVPPDDRSPAANNEKFRLGAQYLTEHPSEIWPLIWEKFLVHWSIDVAPRLNPTEGKVPRLDYHGNVIPETDAGGGLSLGQLPPGDPVGEYSSPLFQAGRMVHIIYWGGLFLLGLVGVAFTARQWREVSLLWFAQISMTAVYIVFHPSTRYRVPTDPLWFLFSAAALVWAWAWWRGRRPRTADAPLTPETPLR
jgi:4-amino-4-deoxy-L-arabinose transferase-like glycosyltransferase